MPSFHHYSLRLLALLFGIICQTVCSAAVTGQPAPSFTATTVENRSVSLKDYLGNIVVLEWTNKDCPFVKKHYQTGNMQALQQRYTNKGVVWLTVLSSAKGKQGYLTASQAKQQMRRDKARMTEFLLDPKGVLARKYHAKVTPHMFVIDAQGQLVYQGAIDANPSANPATVKGTRNYVAETLDALLQKQPIQQGDTRPYGCSVKY